MNDDIEWHLPKEEANIKKHKGLSFDEAKQVFDDPFYLEILLFIRRKAAKNG